MKKLVLVILSLVIFGNHGFSQINIKDKIIEIQKQKILEKRNENLSQQEISEMPKENVKVTKEFDENGNLIRYDSVYTYFYSNTKTAQNPEEIMKYLEEIEQRFKFPGQSIFDQFFNDDEFFFKNFYSDFYNKEIIKDFQKHNHFIESQIEMIRKFLNENYSENTQKTSGKKL